MASTRRGFTLIELMIVVAIVAILAAVAIPNFLRYQAKSRQSEARANLGGIFVAETAYYSEHATYGLLSEVGFVSSYAAARIYTYTDGTEIQVGRTGLVVYAGSVAAGHGTDGFTATAAGVISSNGIVDSWYINHDRILVNEVAGY